MAKAKQTNQINEVVSVQDTETSKEKASKVRANRLAITSTQDGHLQGAFYRTHRHIVTVVSRETGWLAQDTDNKTQQRESYRRYLLDHSEYYGIDWQPQDMRTQENQRKAVYTTDNDLIEDTMELMAGDIGSFISKCEIDMELSTVAIDEITPISVSAKGYDLSKLGVEDGKYLKNGNWAWANIDICYTILVGDTEIYLTLQAQLVSGQLKKPSRIGEGTYCQTSFNNYIKTEMKSAGLLEG